MRRWATHYGFFKLRLSPHPSPPQPWLPSHHFPNVSAEADGMSAESRGTVVAPFTGPLAHLFTRLDVWAVGQRKTLRAEIKILVKAVGGQRLPGKLHTRAARSFQDFHRLNACRKRGVRAVTTLPGATVKIRGAKSNNDPHLFPHLFPCTTRRLGD